ncbi:MAG: GAF domain-containing protein [Candidatus Omnitrophica bacterium]|nr:GAF domain-containing protein [Candidatus Omnitrophota bacterium]
MDPKVQMAIDDMKLVKDKPREEYKRFLTNALCRLTDSTISYFATVNASQNELTMIGWSMSAMMNCTMIDKPLVYKMVDTGLWGDAVRERKPVFTNDYFNLVKATKKGYPKGHVNVRRHLNLPISEDGKVAFVVGVGNKKEAYNDEDACNIEILMKNILADLKTKI